MDGLRFRGIMGYEGHTITIADPDAKRHAISEAIGKLLEARDVIERDGPLCQIVSAGGTGSYQETSTIPGPTELQAGGGIFACRYYTETCHVTGHEPAISVLATVVSKPTPRRVILDIGLKSISQHTTPPVLRDYPDCRFVGLSAEHAKVESDLPIDLEIGEKVHVIPGYSDFTFVLHDRVLLTDTGRVIADWALLGRGCLQ
jgi:D-serine deaminase-like pyridoxal phosphate-dependent protein